MMRGRLLLLFAFYGGMILYPACTPAYAGYVPGPQNPDIKIYEFAHSYITALSYMKDINDRWAKDTPKKLFPHQKMKMILATLNDLALDDSDLRVIKAYMLKYLLSSDMLMRKTADVVVVATSREIAINDEERKLWQKWYDLNAAGQATRPKEIDFVRTQHLLELRRKEADKNIIQASVLLTKLLISEQDRNGKGHRLAITAPQRQKLLDKLDSFGSDTLDWGLKPGQSALAGSIAVIREILEDSIWISIDEK